MGLKRKPQTFKLQVRNILLIDTASPLFTVSITDIDNGIAATRKSLSLLNRSQSQYMTDLHILAMARFSRYQLSHKKEDLDMSILHYTEAIFLPPITQTGPFLNFFQTLFHLAIALLERSEEFEQPEGIKYSFKYIRHLRRFPLDSFDVPRANVTTSLIRALRTQVRLGAGNGTENIKEMVALCNELLSSSKSAVIPTAAFSYLREAVSVEFNRGLPTEMLAEVIECLRDAGKVHPPDSYDAWHEVMYALACTLGIRSIKTHSKEDYEEATVVLERILEPGGCPDSFRVVPLSLASALASALIDGESAFFQEPEYSKVTISRFGEGFTSTSLFHERLRLVFDSIKHRVGEYRLDNSLEEANSYIPPLITASSSSSLADSAELLSWSEVVGETYSAADIQQKIERLKDLLSITPPGTKSYIEYLGHLEKWYKSKFRRTSNISDIEEAIKYSRLLLHATHASDLWRINRLGSLRSTLLLAFQDTGNISYLNESITVGYDTLELKTAQKSDFQATRGLLDSLLTREQLLGRIGDRHEAIRLVSLVINGQYPRVHDRSRLSCQWAILARSIGHPTTLTAYKTAMSLIQKSCSFAPTISTQHARLVAMGEDCQTMPLDYASYQIQLGRFEEAVETLEQGRAILWSEMRGLRTPVCQLMEEDSPLAKRFAEINQELETLTVSVTPGGRPEIGDGVHLGEDGTEDPFGRLVTKRKKLVEERDALISQIQSQPGSEGFSGAPSFDTLRSAASRGPVIIINHCKWRSDIIIICHNSLPWSIPTAETFYADANKLQDKLVKARKRGLDSKEYQDALRSVLKGLYELVGEPVIKRLRVLSVPEQSRIWWCPTSVFCSLPVHAMGPIPSSDGHERYFSDLYIPSYTPSLSALIESRRANGQTPERPSLLLVAQPDDSFPGVNGEIRVIQRALHARLTVASLVSGDATPSSVLEGLRRSRFAHFACHGVLETGKPFDSSFDLHGGSRLTLLDIVRSRLPDAEFAFLSCCFATETTEERVADEELHITAAMQYCGFRSVVGTMWDMVDMDGQDLAKSFYKSLLSSRKTGVPYYERSAGALRYATQRLRQKRGVTLERWVNFVHYGA